GGGGTGRVGDAPGRLRALSGRGRLVPRDGGHTRVRRRPAAATRDARAPDPRRRPRRAPQRSPAAAPLGDSRRGAGGRERRRGGPGGPPGRASFGLAPPPKTGPP